MNITRVVALFLIFAFLFATTSCNTIGSSNMTYLGADDPVPNVTGRGTHTSWAGLGITGSSYVQTYEEARANASRTAQRLLGDDSAPYLYNIKVFRESRNWPQVLAAVLAVAGSLMIIGGQDSYQEEYDPYTGQYEEVNGTNGGLVVMGGLFTVAAAVFSPLRVYDMWIVADYASASGSD